MASNIATKNNIFNGSRHPQSPKVEKFKTKLSAPKIMSSVFWDRQGGVLIVKSLFIGETIIMHY